MIDKLVFSAVNSLLQYLHIMASFLIVSAQNGHCFDSDRFSVFSDVSAVTEVNDHINAATQPRTVQPSSKFVTNIALAL